MDEVEIFNYLKENLRVQICDDSRGSNYEVPGSLGAQVMLWLKNPLTGKEELISQDSCSIG